MTSTRVNIGALRNRGQTYTLLLGTVVGMLVMGLAIPFVFGSNPAESVSAGPADLDFDAGAGSDGTLDPSAPGSPGGSSAEAISGGTASDGVAGNGDSGSGGPAPTSPGGPVDNGGATDVGVTADSIKVAILMPDAGSLGQLGFAGAGGADDAMKMYDAFFKVVNDAGGIHGRIVNRVVINYDPIDENSMRAACVRATEDEKVFSAINFGGYWGHAILCLTKEHGTPFISYAEENHEFHQQADGFYFSLGMNKTRMLASAAAELDRVGALDGKTVGLVDASFYAPDKVAVDKGFIPEMARRNRPIAHRCILGDSGEFQAQIAVCIQQMQQKGVDAVFLANNLVYATSFVQQAESRGFRPQYFNSDHSGGGTDFYVQAMPESYDGALTLTATRVGEPRAGLPEPPPEADCRTRYEQATGEKMPPGHALYASMIVVCGVVDTFVAGATAAPPQLTRRALSDALQRRGDFAAPYILASSFRPGKFDSASAVRFVRFHYNHKGARCQCQVPASEPRPAPL